MFNPFASRSGTLSFIAEAATSFERINRRMHNKSWIADNRIAIVGGRNIGDEYFGASDDVNFVDLDFAMIGPVVRDASASFDNYWNSPSAYPMEVLDPQGVTADALDRLRDALGRARGEGENRAATRRHCAPTMRSSAWSPASGRCSGRRTIASSPDDPLKVTMKKRDAQRTHVGAALVPLVESGATTLVDHLAVLCSRRGGDGRGWRELVSGGKDVRMLTNSLVANDVAAVHGGYSRHRQDLLEGGVQIWELKPLPGTQANSSLFGSSGASLHTKAFAVDGRTLFVGSYNLDPRSTWLNCEQGVFAQSEPLALQLEQIFDRQTSGEHAWRVSLDAGKLHWTDGHESLDHEPHASWGRRFQAWLARTLRLDAQL